MRHPKETIFLGKSLQRSQVLAGFYAKSQVYILFEIALFRPISQ
jgi:hypothetical protein